MKDKFDEILWILGCEKTYKSRSKHTMRKVVDHVLCGEEDKKLIPIAEKLYCKHFGWPLVKYDLIGFYKSMLTESEINDIVYSRSRDVLDKIFALGPLVQEYLYKKQEPKMAAFITNFDKLMMSELQKDYKQCCYQGNQNGN